VAVAATWWRWASATRAAVWAPVRRSPVWMMTTVASPDTTATSASAERPMRTERSGPITPPAGGGALRAERGAARVWRGATGALSACRRSVLAEQVLDLGQLGVDLLQRRGLAHEHLEVHVVPDRHLVEQAAEL
jgi:hypothetical protein